MKRLCAALLTITVVAVCLYPSAKTVQAAAGPQIFYGRNSDPAAVSVSRRLKLDDFGAIASFATSTFGVLPIPGTFSNLKVDVDTAPGGATSWVATLVEGASTNTVVTCTITSAVTSCSDVSHTFSATAGLVYHINVVATGGSPAATYIRFSIKFTPTTTGHTAIVAGTSYSTGFLVYAALSVNPGTALAETSRRQIMPEAGTFQNFYADISASPGAGASYINTLRTFSGGTAATSSITCTVSGSTARSCNDTVDTASISANDSVDYALQPSTGTVPAASNPGFGIDFVPNSAGDFLLPAYSTGADSATLVNYLPATGSFSATAKEASTTVTAQAMTITTIAATSSASPGVGKTRTFYLRQNNATTSLSCAISGTARSCSGSGSISVSNGDTIDIADEPTGTPATFSNFSVTLVANANTASPSGPVTPSDTIINSGVVIMSKTVIN